MLLRKILFLLYSFVMKGKFENIRGLGGFEMLIFDVLLLCNVVNDDWLIIIIYELLKYSI